MMSMGKTALMPLVMLALFAFIIYGQGQTDQSTASATTTTTTTTGSSLVSTTATTTATGIALYEADPSSLIGKAHIKIAKQSNNPNECIYIITIEDGDILSPLLPGFTPKDIVATFSVNNNVYIEYDNMKVDYSLYDYKTGTSNYVPYNPTPCASNAKDFITAVVGTIPGPDVLCGVYDIFRSGGELIGCLSYLYDWQSEVTVNGNDVKNKRQEESQSKKVDKNYYFEKIMGATEKDRNDRRVETITYSEDPTLELSSIPPRSVMITIPVRSKDSTLDSDFRLWIDIRAYSSTGVILKGSDQGKSNALNTGTSLMTKSLGIYFENDNLFKKGQKEVPKTTEEPTNKDLHSPLTNREDSKLKWDENGHYYELVKKSLNWNDAKSYAEAQKFSNTESGLAYKGHLASITSSDENLWIVQNLLSPASEENYVIWLGGYQEENAKIASEGWHWITNEPWSFENWSIGEPNDDSKKKERYLDMWSWDGSTGNARKGAWNDEIAEGSRLCPYYLLIEYEPTEQTTLDLHPPVLSDAKVSLDCGSESDPFTFSVVYKDEDGDEAKDAYVRIIGFDGTNEIYDTQDDINLGKMVKGPGEPSSGVQYTYTTTLHAAPECYYRFYFSNQVGSKAYLPDTKTSLGYAGPRVGAGCPENEDLHPPVLSDAKVAPDCGQEKSDEFNFSVIYKDEDGDDPAEANIAIRGWAFDSTRTVYNSDYNDMTKISGDAKQGAVYSFKTQLPEKGEYHYTIYFTNSKGVTVRLPEQGFGDNYGLPGPIVGKECMRATITVPATDDWIDTDFQVSEGDSIKFEASGQATYGHESYKYEGYPTTDPDGNRFLNNINIERKIDSNAVNTSVPIGSLIGKVGLNGDCFYIGSNNQLRMPASGTIMLRYNDEEGEYANNGGSYEVIISKNG